MHTRLRDSQGLISNALVFRSWPLLNGQVVLKMVQVLVESFLLVLKGRNGLESFEVLVLFKQTFALLVESSDPESVGVHHVNHS